MNEGMKLYPHGWEVWSKGVQAFMDDRGIVPNYICTS